MALEEERLKRNAYMRKWRIRKMAEDPDFQKKQTAKRQAAMREWRAANRERIAEQNRVYRAVRPEWCKEISRRTDLRRRTDPEVHAKRMEYMRKRYADQLVLTMYNAAKARAKRFGWAFSITKQHIVVPEKCPIFGIDLYVGDGKRTHNSPSLDKIDNRLGYIPGNVRVISWRANNLKRDATPEELIALAEDAKQFCQKLEVA